jgi:hypothetical protein
LFLNPFYLLTRKFLFYCNCIFIAVLLIMLPEPARSQQPDTVAADTVIRNHNPRMAVLFSALVPGMGQVYNQKYWKVPIIYGAGGAFAYFVGFNQLKYKKFRDAVASGTQDEVVLIDGRYIPSENLERGRDYYRRYRDISVLGLGAIYLLNIIDAMIDANFFYYDVSDDLSMQLQPVMINMPGTTASLGFQINIGF